MIQPHGVLVVAAVGSAGCSGSTGVVSGSKMVTAGAGAVSGGVVGSGAVVSISVVVISAVVRGDVTAAAGSVGVTARSRGRQAGQGCQRAAVATASTRSQCEARDGRNGQ